MSTSTLWKSIWFVLFAILLGWAFLFFKTTPAVAPTQSPDLQPTQEKNIIILSPQPGESVGNPVHVVGKARVFEATFAYKIKDSAGRTLINGNAMTTGASVPEYGDINLQIPIPYLEPELVAGNGSPTVLFLEVFEYSAKDGEVINLVSVPVQLDSTDTSTVKVYFSSGWHEPEVSCDKVSPVTRTIYKTPQVGFLAIAELLRGPTPAESNMEYVTAIPESFKLNNLSIQNGIATVDFQNYGPAPAGSCAVTIIRTQVEATLKQFPAVKSVVISVNGRTEDALQP